jgi:hypothetical protein
MTLPGISITNPRARVWIYQSNRSFAEKEVSELLIHGKHFTRSWNAHGNALAAELVVLHNRFIVLILDESQNNASGCSIDKSVELMRQIEQQYNVVLFDRYAVAYRDENNVLQSCTIDEFGSRFNRGEVTNETLVYNNLVSTLDEMQSNWLLPLKESWHSRLIETV